MGMIIETRSDREVILRIREADPMETAQDYSRRHPDFLGRISVHSRTVPRGSGDVPVSLWATFDATGGGEVAWIFTQFESERREFPVR